MKQPAVSAFLAMLRSMKCFDDISAVFFVRAQDELAISSFSTALKFGRRDWFATQHIRPKNPYFNHFAAAEMWASELGDKAILIRRYARGGTNVPAEFMAVLGIADISGYEPPRQMNEAWPEQAASCMPSINSCPIRAKQNKRKRRPISRHLRNIIAQAIARPGLPIYAFQVPVAATAHGDTLGIRTGEQIAFAEIWSEFRILRSRRRRLRARTRRRDGYRTVGESADCLCQGGGQVGRTAR
jgi:hypothetical protein